MILIAPDKFKGTLTAREATDIIASAIAPREYLRAPMADGGEGTSAILCSSARCDVHDCYFVDQATSTAYIDSSAVIGLSNVELKKQDILKRSSLPLGVKVREILKGGCEKVVIGIGGTATCDGGEGFLVGLGIDKLAQYRHRIIGLSDVEVPLVADGDKPSALMFAPQKGATSFDIKILRGRLTQLYQTYRNRRSPYDGAGGGLGFAIASVIGAKCTAGAQYVLDHYNIDWSKISLVITGEGSIDAQTSQGKVVSVITSNAQRNGVKVVAFGGRVDFSMRSDTVISTDTYYPDMPLNKSTAALRLKAAVSDFIARQAD